MPASNIDAPANLRVAFVLGGGNALGAFHAGLYEALEQGGIEPDWIVGTSIGAVTGAIIAGNAREARLKQLRQLWRPGSGAGEWLTPTDFLPETLRRTGAVLETLVAGRGGMFAPLASGSAWWTHDPAAGAPALYDTQVLSGTLQDLIDFDRLNRNDPRFTAASVDIETGEEVWLDTRERALTPDHIRASAALMTTFPAIAVDGRLLGDGGLSTNLPLDPVMTSPDRAPVLCIASDLLPLAAPRPRSLGEAIGRTQDLMFAAQSRRTVERWQAIFAADDARADTSITLVSLSYGQQGREVAGKAMDFSPRSVRERWDAGFGAGTRTLERLKSGDIALGRSGLTVHSDAHPSPGKQDG